MNNQTNHSSAGRRGWLASLLLRQPERFLPRLISAVGRWRDLPRRLRRRIQRQTAAGALAAALLLAMGGAAFYAPPAHAATIEVDDGFVVAADDGSCSLREAIRNANSNSQVFTSDGECEPGSGADVISLPENGVFNITEYIDNFNLYYLGFSELGLPIVNSTITIEGNGSLIQRDSVDEFRILAVDYSGNLTLNDVTLSNGHSIGYGGGAIYSRGTLTINDSNFLNNTTDTGGGAIPIYTGTAKIYDSYFPGNSAPYYGGAILKYSGDLTISGTTITGNNSTRGGGGVFNRTGSLTIIDSEITLNRTNRNGGGVGSLNGTVNITGSEINENATTGTNPSISHDGGGVFMNNGSLTISDSEVNDNTATGIGGGVMVKVGSLTLEDSEVSGNTAVSGGGIYHAGTTLDVDGSTISLNDTTGGVGGGITLAAGTMEMNLSTLSDNDAVAGGGGGLRVDTNATARIFDSTIARNDAGVAPDKRSGGGISNNGLLYIYGSTISENTSTDNGGGIVTSNDFLLVNSTVSGNEAANIGGGIRVAFETTKIYNSTLTDNVSGGYGGGVGLNRVLGSYPQGSSEVLVKRSIISGNQSDEGHEVHTFDYTYHAKFYNSVIGRAGISNGAATAGVPIGPGNFNATNNGTPTAIENILDLNLAANGGPTKTHLLAEGSPALDLAPSDACAADPVGGVDQRGEPRNIDANNDVTVNECDAGAVEGTEAIVEPPAVFLSTKKAGSVDGVGFGNEDILKWKEGVWTVWFDGSAAGLAPNDKPKHNTNAFWFPDEEEQDVVIAFAQNRRKVPDISQPVDGTDLVWWDGAKFTFWFDGSDVDLKVKTKEKIDGLHVLPGDAAPDEFGGVCEAYLLISTQGPGKVQRAAAFGGGALKFGGEDVLGFCATSLGEDTAGLWHMALDGSAVGLAKNSVDGISLSEDGQTLFLTMKKAVKTPFVVGHSKVVAVDLETGVVSGPYFSAPDNGLNRQVDGLQVEGVLGD